MRSPPWRSLTAPRRSASERTIAHLVRFRHAGGGINGAASIHRRWIAGGEAFFQRLVEGAVLMLLLGLVRCDGEACQPICQIGHILAGRVLSFSGCQHPLAIRFGDEARFAHSCVPVAISEM